MSNIPSLVEVNKFEVAINLISKYFADGTPFFCLFDFEIKNPEVIKLDDLKKKNILFNFNGKRNYEVSSDCIVPSILNKYPLAFQEYEGKYNIVKNAIYEGESYLLNLTCRTPVQISASLNEIFHSTTAKYKLLYKDKFVVFSPETFIEVRDEYIYTYPMKGTIDSSIPDAENIVMDDSKEKAEQVTVVDLLRNDLSIVAEDVKVTKFRYVDEISAGAKKLLQVSSEISGKIKDEYKNNFGSMLLKLLPAGSVSGAPKKRTVELIKEVEQIERGYYTGIAGIYDGKNFDSAVLIRYIEKDDDKYYFRSGGGITHLSNSLDEYNEMIEKIYVPSL